jgi:diguanylate cyclase (GGDEF)-like protein
LTKQLRADDIAGRFGGDEFILFFPNTKAQDAVKLLERIRHNLANKPFTTEPFANEQGHDFSITATFGVAQWTVEHKDSAALLASADQALYQAKENGRDQVVAGSSRSV